MKYAFLLQMVILICISNSCSKNNIVAGQIPETSGRDSTSITTYTTDFIASTWDSVSNDNYRYIITLPELSNANTYIRNLSLLAEISGAYLELTVNPVECTDGELWFEFDSGEYVLFFHTAGRPPSIHVRAVVTVYHS